VESPIETAVPGSDDVAPKAQGSEGGLKSLAEGLKAMGDGKVFAGIGAVALAGPAFIVALPSIPFLLFMGKVKLKQLEENFTGLAAGLNSMSTTFMGSLAMGAFGIAAIPSILSIPFLLFMGKVSLKKLATNFIELGVGLQIMSSTFMEFSCTCCVWCSSLNSNTIIVILSRNCTIGWCRSSGVNSSWRWARGIRWSCGYWVTVSCNRINRSIGSSYDSIRNRSNVCNTSNRSIREYNYRSNGSSSTDYRSYC
jgi:hypothetical protein